MYSVKKKQSTKDIIITTKNIYTEATNHLAYSTYNCSMVLFNQNLSFLTKPTLLNILELESKNRSSKNANTFPL